MGTDTASEIVKKLPDVMHFVLALALVVGIIVVFVVTGVIPEVLAFALTTVIGYYFGRSGRSSRNV